MTKILNPLKSFSPSLEGRGLGWGCFKLIILNAKHAKERKDIFVILSECEESLFVLKEGGFFGRVALSEWQIREFKKEPNGSFILFAKN